MSLNPKTEVVDTDQVDDEIVDDFYFEDGIISADSCTPSEQEDMDFYDLYDGGTPYHGHHSSTTSLLDDPPYSDSDLSGNEGDDNEDTCRVLPSRYLSVKDNATDKVGGTSCAMCGSLDGSHQSYEHDGRIHYCSPEIKEES